MSPSNISSFVGDLVQMAQAVEQLPKVEAELENVKAINDEQGKVIASREEAIIRYKQEIESLNSRIRSLEVERDDASFRVLESEDLAHKALSFARQAENAAAAVMSLLDPPKPELVKEPEAPPATPAEGHSASDPTTGQEQSGETLGSDHSQASIPEAVHSIHEADWKQDQAETSMMPRDQSESRPTVTHDVGGQVSAGSQSATTAQGADGVTANHGPYSGKHYHDVPTYIQLADWLAGGGTEEDYYWRPSRPFAI